MLTDHSDANWARKASDRRSSDGVLMHRSRYIKSWSTTHLLVALSSAESELSALVKASAEATRSNLCGRVAPEKSSEDIPNKFDARLFCHMM